MFFAWMYCAPNYDSNLFEQISSVPSFADNYSTEFPVNITQFSYPSNTKAGKTKS